jgi:hypothetical protein
MLALVACVAMYADQHGGRQPGVVVAYIDPGTGALALQLVGAVFVGLLFYLKRVRAFLSRIWMTAWRRRRP